MRQLAVLVEFLVKDGFAARFGELILANAKASLNGEEGCRQFDVLVGPDEPRRFVLYEIYDDERAFDLIYALGTIRASPKRSKAKWRSARSGACRSMVR